MSQDLPSKACLREQLRQRRRQLSSRQQSDAAQALVKSVFALPNWHSANRIALYMSSDGEVDTAPIAAAARQAHKQLYLPAVGPEQTLTFVSWREDDALVPNRFGILEPPENNPSCEPAELDVILLPLVAWDRVGGRLGMGGGFYDRALAATRGPLLVGLAHQFQEVGQLPCDAHDVQLDFVASEDTLIDCQPGDA